MENKREKLDVSKVAEQPDPWRLGDWCFADFELHQVVGIDEGNVTDLSDGLTRKGSLSFNNEIFPLDLRGKNISDSYKHYYDRIRQETKPLNLNYPDIMGWFASHWAGTMRIRKSDEDVRKRIDELTGFFNELINAANASKYASVMGVKLFRR